MVPRISDSSLEPEGSGDFLFSRYPLIPSPGGKVARPSASEEKAGRKRNAGDNPKVSTHSRPPKRLVTERKAGEGLRVSCRQTSPPAFLFSQKIGSEEPIF